MRREKKILFVSHCIINQNTVIEGEARAEGAVLSATSWAMKEGFGIVQLPCPEFTFLGLGRPPLTYEEYDTIEYRNHCREVLKPIITQALEYNQHGYTITGVLGIQSSPSCDPGRGVFMEELQNLFAENQLKFEHRWYLPDTNEPDFNSEKHFLP